MFLYVGFELLISQLKKKKKIPKHANVHPDYT